MLSCKKDKIRLGGDGFGVRSDAEFHVALTFLSKEGETDDYSFEIDASESSPELSFHQVRYAKNHGRGEYKYFRFPSFGNKGMVKLDKSKKRPYPYKKEPYVMIGINLKSIKIGKEQSFKVKVYQNDKIIDVKTVTFITVLGPYGDGSSIAQAGVLEKLCISNWKNVEDVTKYSLVIDFKYPESKYDSNSEALKHLRKALDDCYIEDPDSDRY